MFLTEMRNIKKSWHELCSVGLEVVSSLPVYIQENIHMCISLIFSTKRNQALWIKGDSRAGVGKVQN